ncbi:EamA family transporter, partial [Candidatus Saccharibacteria bacterium]|nr:EamA family transporter [Candidatus Saccharibacteria bacterium]
GMYHWGLKKLSGEQSSVLHYLDPLGGVMASILILGDKVTPLILLGGGLTILGVYSSGSKVKLRLHHFHSHK